MDGVSSRGQRDGGGGTLRERGIVNLQRGFRIVPTSFHMKDQQKPEAQRLMVRNRAIFFFNNFFSMRNVMERVEKRFSYGGCVAVGHYIKREKGVDGFPFFTSRTHGC